jgi:hypothetical protein
MAGYVGRGVGIKKIRVSGTTMFALAAQYLNDATQWYRIAALNNINDPWIGALTTLLIPPPQTFSNGGILDGIILQPTPGAFVQQTFWSPSFTPQRRMMIPVLTGWQAQDPLPTPHPHGNQGATWF